MAKGPKWFAYEIEVEFDVAAVQVEVKFEMKLELTKFSSEVVVTVDAGDVTCRI